MSLKNGKTMGKRYILVADDEQVMLGINQFSGKTYCYTNEYINMEVTSYSWNCRNIR